MGWNTKNEKFTHGGWKEAGKYYKKMEREKDLPLP